MAAVPYPSGFVIFCDDVRYEFNGKVTLVGTYFNDIVFSGTNGGVLPYLHLQVGYRLDPRSPPKRLVTRAMFCGEDGEDSILAEDVVDFPSELPPAPPTQRRDGIRVLELRRFMVIAPAFFHGPGRIRVTGSYEGNELRLGSLNVSFDPKQPQ